MLARLFTIMLLCRILLSDGSFNNQGTCEMWESKTQQFSASSMRRLEPMSAAELTKLALRYSARAQPAFSIWGIIMA